MNCNSSVECVQGATLLHICTHLIFKEEGDVYYTRSEMELEIEKVVLSLQNNLFFGTLEHAKCTSS